MLLASPNGIALTTPEDIVLRKLEVFLICENLYNNNIWINKNKMLKPV